DFTSSNTDTTCVIVCKSVAGSVICDTTIIITVQPPTPDTIIQLTNGMPTDTCLVQPELVGTMFTYTSCGNPTQGVLTNNSDTCFNYTPINNVLDTSCVIICDEYGICDTTVFIYVPPVTPDTIYTLDTNVCVDTTEMPNGYHTATGCDGLNPTTTSNGGPVSIDAQGCAAISPVFVGKTDTTCVIICDTVFGICDTTLIINVRRAVPDTIVECIPRDGQANDSNMNTNDLLGDVATISVFKLPSHGQFTLTNDTNSSYQTSPFPTLDTVQVSFCDEYNFCDTFTFIYIPPMTPDTIYTQGAGVTCVDTTEMPVNRYTSIGTCDGMNMTANGGTVAVLAGGCVDITPDFTSSNIDTTCVILCDTILPMCECDTTYVISFAPTVPDTFAILLPKGTNTADTCLSTDELFGSSYTYRRLGAPTPHGPITTHNDTCINYVQTSTTKFLDTARVLICDEYGNCDTTIIIYVPTPDPDTLFVGPVIPVTNVDTCVPLESTYMTGHYINTCDSTGTSNGGVPVTITGLCVRYPVPAPIFTGDTTCIIVCDTIRNITICDTTLIVYLPDTTPPTVVCKNDTVYLNNLGTAMIDTSNVVDTVFDNTLVHSVTASPTMFNCSNVGPNNVTVIATDTNRNVDSCIAIVTVLDTLAPTAVCQNITIQLDSNGNASIVALDVDGGSFDNCAIASMVVSQTSFDCSNIGTNAVILTVTDIYGNVSTCTATVTVEDNIAPIAYCPGDKQMVIRNTTCSYIVEDFLSEASSWDNCDLGSVTLTQSPAAGTEVFLENASETITITATDASMNTSSCTFEVYARCVKELDIPQFISPDGSGKNDTWEIPELANYSENVVKVFNRWGNLVMEQKGYSTGWDGRANVNTGVNRLLDNKMLPEGTYFYIIDLGDNTTEPYVGYLQLKR
ncbi:MAG: gliding motility-associated C-terminal domain-containing protein, partial [Flavobacteriales bacterium]